MGIIDPSKLLHIRIQNNKFRKLFIYGGSKKLYIVGFLSNSCMLMELTFISFNWNCLSSILSSDCDWKLPKNYLYYLAVKLMQLEQNQALHLNVKVKVSIQQLLFVFLKNVLCSICFNVEWFSSENIFSKTYISLEIKTFFGTHMENNKYLLYIHSIIIIYKNKHFFKT